MLDEASKPLLSVALGGWSALCDENAIGLGAQTSRPDDAGPVRNLHGGMASQGTLLTSLNTRRV